jgi:hypothetical protein
MLIFAMLFVLVVPVGVGAQAQPDVWKTFASRIDVGVQLNVRLRNGQKFRATLIDAREDVLLLQPRTPSRCRCNQWPTMRSSHSSR